jgi:signal transduction histidine kinase
MNTGSGPAVNFTVSTLDPSPKTQLSGHTVQFYEEDSSLLDSLTKLIGTSLMAGDIAFVVATPAHREGLAERLKAFGLDLEVSARLGRYCAFDAAETLSGFMVDGVLNSTLFHSFVKYILSSIRPAADGKRPGVVIFGEMVALLWANGNIDAALQLERLWNDLAKLHVFQIYCAYPMKVFGQEGQSQSFRDLCAKHTHVIPTEYTQLASEGDRLFHIALLQQRAITAEAETQAEAARRLRAEEALRRSEKLAASGRLAASIAHEINNPLEAISNSIYLARTCPPEEIATYLKLADEELKRVAQITKRTLGFYRETATPSVVKLSALLDDLLILFDRKLAAKKLTVNKQYRDELEIWGLEGELRQVFANQIANAIYAMPDNGRLTIRIRKSKSWSNGQCPGTAVSLVDNGSGISRESLPKIFDAFFTTKQDVGNGLGLWITHDIVTRHGGSIRVRSNALPGASGAIFTTFFPHHEANSSTGI